MSSDSDNPSLNSSVSLDKIFQKLYSSSCSSISEDTDSNGVQTDHIADDLARWASEFNIPNNATTKLFHIFNIKIPSLPLDARTVLKTTRNVNVEKFCNGSYIYFGIENSLVKKASSGSKQRTYPIVEEIKNKLKTDLIFTLTLNTDGLPISDSSSSSFWPILGILDQADDTSPFVIVLFHGQAKPDNANEFFKPFVEECLHLEAQGIVFNNKIYAFRISCIIADAPARAFLKCIVAFNSLNGCEKCTQEGKHFGRTTWQYVVVPDKQSPLRTDEGFRSMIYDDHQRLVSEISKLDIGLISQVPIDYMHQICLGIVKRLIRVWVEKGPKSCKLNALKIQQISERLVLIAQHDTPSEFSRKPRELKLFKFWKATEFRAFLLYFGPVVLKGVLQNHLYDHFVILHVAIYILASAKYSEQPQWQSFANRLCNTFVEYTSVFYAKELMLYNFHNLLHVVNDVVNFGPLDCYSAFPFEHFMRTLKGMVRGPKNALQQVAKR